MLIPSAGCFEDQAGWGGDGDSSRGHSVGYRFPVDVHASRGAPGRRSIEDDDGLGAASTLVIVDELTGGVREPKVWKSLPNVWSSRMSGWQTGPSGVSEWGGRVEAVVVTFYHLRDSSPRRGVSNMTPFMSIHATCSQIARRLMSIIETLLPKQASNDFRGGAIPFYGFCLLLLPITFRVLVHFFKSDSGVNSIASIHLFPGDPDPNVVIHMYSSLWGSQQAITLLIYCAVLYRYRNLIPLMFLLMIVEIGFRMIVGTLHPLTDEFFVRTPPGKIGNLPMAIYSLAMLTLAHRNVIAAK